MAHKSYALSTDREVMQDLGRRLQLLRETRRMTAVEAAAQAGLSRRTVWRAESGGNPTLLTLLRLLRLYGRIDALENFVPEPEISPMALLKQRKPRAEPPRG
jgi:transcriptional regulator with XRE-family HTH domain